MIRHGSELTCLFCGLPAPQVRRLINGPDGSICDQCVTLAAEEIAAQDQADGILPREIDQGLRAKDRLECLKLAVATLGGQRFEPQYIERAAIFAAYVSDGLAPSAGAPAITQEGRPQ